MAKGVIFQPSHHSIYYLLATWVQPRPTRNNIYKSNFLLTKSNFLDPPSTRTGEISKGHLVGCVFWCLNFWKTSLRSPSLSSWVTTSSPSRFDRSVRCARKPQIFRFSSRVHWIYRFEGALDFAVKSVKGAYDHSRNQTRWLQANFSFFENLCIRNTAD